MKKIICEICSNDSFTKQDGNFICQSCGTVYSANDIKSMIKEFDDISVPIKATKPVSRIIKNATNNSSETQDDNLKLQYDLYCWHNFYEKCHELEKAEPFADEGLSQCDDVSDKNYQGSIVVRKVNFDKEKYYSTTVEPVIVEQFHNINPSFNQKYEEYKAKTTAHNDEIAREQNRVSSTICRAFSIGGVIFAIIFIIIAVSVARSTESTPLGIFIGCIGVSGSLLIALLGGLGHFDKTPDKFRDSYIKLMEKKEWEKNNLLNDASYVEFINEKRKKYDITINSYINRVLEQVPLLKKIYNELNESIPLPEKYKDEYHVNCLLALVIDRRADTLKEAINMFETEIYRSSIVSCLDRLNVNLDLLSNKLSNLTNLTYQGFSTVIRQNNIISEQLSALQFTAIATFTLDKLTD